MYTLTRRPDADRRRPFAFTLIELIVVVIIVGVLAAIAAVSYNTFVGSSRDTALIASAKHLAGSVMAAVARDDVSSDSEVAAAWSAGGSDSVKTKFFATYGGTLTYTPGTAGAAGTLDVASPESTRHACITLATDTATTPTVSLGQCAGASSGMTAPTLTATPAAGKVTLAWAAVTGATSYDVTRNGTVLTTVTSPGYTDSAVTGGTSYSYTVTAKSASASAVSNTVTATPPAGGLQIVDTFTRANAATLGTTSDGNAVWTAQAGSWGISGNTAYTSALGANNYSLATVDVGTGNQVATLGVTGSYTALAFRVSDANNFWMLQVNGGNAASLYKIVNGVRNGPLVNYTGVGASTARLETYGSTIDLYAASGALLGTYTDPFNATATKIGLYSNGIGATYPLTNFSAKDEAVTAPSQVGTLTATTSSTGITVSWPASPQPDVTAYRVYRNGTQIAQTGAVTSYTDTTAAVSTIYSYQVSAVDASGNEGTQSAAVQAERPTAGPQSVVDTFARPDSTTGLGATSDGKQLWQALNGTWGIHSNSGYNVSLNGGTYSLAAVELGSGNQSVSVTTVAMQTNLAFRISDSKNFYFLGASNVAANLYKVVNGVGSNVGSFSGAVNQVARVVTSGNTITIENAAGASIGTYTDSFNATATKAGVYGVPTNTADTVTNFSGTGS